MEPHPIRVVVEDDLRRSRLTVFFRLILAIPHLIWFVLWSIAVFFAAILAWFIVLATAQLPQAFHRFFSAYVRYSTHLHAYLYLAANDYPGFVGEAGDYPVDVEDRPAGAAEPLEDAPSLLHRPSGHPPDDHPQRGAGRRRRRRRVADRRLGGW